MISEGDLAPEFELPRDSSDGENISVSLAELKGRIVVLYFYPKDDTSGCTKQAIGFTESLKSFSDQSATILGVSPDTVKKHDKFKDKHELQITLLSDEEKEVVQTYGVWVEKSMYGRKYMGVERSTFLIDTDGKIARVWRKVKVPGHVDEVLEAVKELSS